MLFTRAISSELSKLEEAGMVQRKPSPDDGRAKFVSLTRRGKNILQKIWEVHESQLEHVMIGLDNDERLELTHLLNKMIAAHAAPEVVAAGAEAS